YVQLRCAFRLSQETALVDGPGQYLIEGLPPERPGGVVEVYDALAFEDDGCETLADLLVVVAHFRNGRFPPRGNQPDQFGQQRLAAAGGRCLEEEQRTGTINGWAGENGEDGRQPGGQMAVVLDGKFLDQEQQR